MLRRSAAIAVLLLALGLRVAGIDFGLPMAEARPDEITIAFQAMKFGIGDLNPHSFNYPTLFKYITFAMFGGYYVVGRAVHHFADKDAFLLAFFNGEAGFRLLMRGWSAVVGTAGVGLLLGMPGRVVSALFLGACFLHVRDSHFGVTDITMVTLVLAAVWQADCAMSPRGAPSLAARRRNVGMAAVLAGLATSVKYNAAVLGLPLVLAAWFALGSGTAVLWAVGAMGAAFLAGSPFVLLDASTFVRDFLFEARHLSEGQHVAVGTGWTHHATVTLPTALGVPLFVVGCLGTIGFFGVSPRRAAVIFSFPVVYYIAIGHGGTAFFRYMLPVLPFLCVGAGWMVEQTALRVPRPFGGGVALLLTMALAVPTLRDAVEADRLFMSGDTRVSMGEWIEANVSSDAMIVHAGAYTGAPMLQRNIVNQTREYAAKAGRADASGFRKPDDMKWYDHQRPMYDVVFVEKSGIDFASQRSTADVVADPPPYLEVESYPLVFYSAVPDEIGALLDDRYAMIHRENSYDADRASPSDLDQQDAFYMPSRRFSAYTRMGPTLTLYKRVD